MIKEHPDIGGNGKKAANFAEAKQIFKELAPGACASCGVIFSRGAMHCRIHSRAQNKMIATPAMAETEQRGTNNNVRVHLMPVGGPLAEIGYFSAPVQKAARKWAKKIGE